MHLLADASTRLDENESVKALGPEPGPVHPRFVGPGRRPYGEHETTAIAVPVKHRSAAMTRCSSRSTAYITAADSTFAASTTTNATILSDEYAATLVDGEPEGWSFTGAFVGLWVQDLGAEGGYTDFD